MSHIAGGAGGVQSSRSVHKYSRLMSPERWRGTGRHGGGRVQKRLGNCRNSKQKEPLDQTLEADWTTTFIKKKIIFYVYIENIKRVYKKQNFV